MVARIMLWSEGMTPFTRMVRGLKSTTTLYAGTFSRLLAKM